MSRLSVQNIGMFKRAWAIYRHPNRYVFLWSVSLQSHNLMNVGPLN